MDSKQFIEIGTAASGILRGLASIPAGADNAIIRVETGTVRWSETTGSWLNASVGMLLGAVDQPFRIGNGVPLTAFAYVPVGGAAALQVSYYSYRGVGNYI